MICNTVACAAPFNRKRVWTPALHTDLRLAYAVPTKTACSAALTELVRKTGWPRHAFKSQAIKLGITREVRRGWTKEEVRILASQLGESTVKQIARRLGRSTLSVASRADKLGLSRRVRDGYCIADLRQILGAPYHRIHDWIEQGLLGEAVLMGNSGVRIKDEALVQFIRGNLALIDLRMADQTFLKGVLSHGSR